MSGMMDDLYNAQTAATTAQVEARELHAEIERLRAEIQEKDTILKRCDRIIAEYAAKEAKRVKQRKE